ncbi:MAG: VIT1/CCC1 transporter family protein [Bdellovibrionales bacterium]|nr:VIT1/CCC1 transporter family protein [Bdellovibrionales bacterium]
MHDPKNPLHLDAFHTDDAIINRIRSASHHGYVGDFVLGAIDGTITTFAIIASAAGAGLSAGIAIILGIANVLADGISMAAGNYLRSRTEKQTIQKYRSIEEMHIAQVPESERNEIRHIFREKGFEGSLLDEIVTVITSNKKRWVDTMLTEEWGIQLDPPNAIRVALVTFVAFVCCGLIPVAPLLFFLDGDAQLGFLLSSIVAFLSFFFIGVSKGMLLRETNPLIAGLETLLVGGAAAGAAYLAGLFLQSIVA